MNNDNVHSLRRLVAILPVLGLLVFTGCASTPDEEESETTPVAETSPLTAQQEQPAVAVEASTPAKAVELAINHPQRYVVVKGDTLWEISERFLRDPWRWPEVWQDNPQVSNPHLIFPGDTLSVVMINGQPTIQLERGTVARAAGVTETVTSSRTPLDANGKPLKVVKLSPQVRELDLQQAIPTIQPDAIRQFLNNSLVVEMNELERAPYVVDFADEHMSGGAGYRLYARGISEEEPGNYTVVRPNKEYRDPDSGERLGQEAIYLANANIERVGDPTTLMIQKSNREVLRGDRLIPGDATQMSQPYVPHAPDGDVKGKIISAFDAVNQIGQHQVVVISLGRRNGMEPGHVLAIYQDGKTVRDQVAGGRVKLPDERAGTLMVFRTFDKVSYALVMRATRAINLYDRVQNP